MLTRATGLTEDQGQVPIENVYAHLLRYNVISYFIDKNNVYSFPWLNRRPGASAY